MCGGVQTAPNTRKKSQIETNAPHLDARGLEAEGGQEQAHRERAPAASRELALRRGEAGKQQQRGDGRAQEAQLVVDKLGGRAVSRLRLWLPRIRRVGGARGGLGSPRRARCISARLHGFSFLFLR